MQRPKPEAGAVPPWANWRWLNRLCCAQVGKHCYCYKNVFAGGAKPTQPRQKSMSWQGFTARKHTLNERQVGVRLKVCVQYYTARVLIKQNLI
jgi:hypothetical protein